MARAACRVTLPSSTISWNRSCVSCGGAPVELSRYIDAIEAKLGLNITRNLLPMQQGDVRDTFANADLLQKLTGYKPATPVETGVGKFIDWYREYFRV
jgi:UDP-glucuronate 4-epimerase